MTAKRLDLALEQGATFKLPLRYLGAGGLAGATVRLQVRAAVGQPVLLDLSSPATGITIDDAATGAYTVTITAAQTAALAPTGNAPLAYDIKISGLAGGAVVRHYEGTVSVSPQITV